MNDSLSRVIQSDAFDDKEWSFEACGLGWPDDRRPSIKYGLMASADEVISSDTLRIRMLEGAGGEKKLLGIEMEAGGVCAAADRRRVPYCMLRVISDQADPSKTDNEWRKLGMETIAHLLVKLPLDEVLRLAA
jgi:nucleoside phosphorylase